MLFRFTLNNEDKGALVLAQDPQGWRDLETILKRGLEYHGTFYETMVQLEFSCGSGKEYIDEIYNEFGVDAVIEIKIEISCDSGGVSNISNDYSIDYSIDYGSFTQGSNVIQYETFYEGVLDLSKYNTTTRSTFCDIIQSDFIQKTINRFSTTVEITQDKSLDDVTLLPIADFPSDVTLHSKSVIFETKFSWFDFAENLFMPPTQVSLFIAVPLSIVIDELGGAVEATPPLTRFIRSIEVTDIGLLSPFYRNTSGDLISIDLYYTFKFDLKFTLPITATTEINLVLSYNNNGVNPYLSGTKVFLQTIASAVYTGGTEYTVTFNVSGDELGLIIVNGLYSHFYIQLDNLPTGASGSNFDINIIGDEIDVNYKTISTVDDSEAKIFKIHELGAAISQRITSLEDAFRSTLLGRTNSAPNSYEGNGCMSFAGVLNGKHIRGFEIVDAPLFVSMNEYFKSINSYYNIGLGFEKENGVYVIRIEGKEYFYDASVVLIQCPFANEIKTSVAKEYYITELLVGYDEWTVDNINGLNEVNSKRTYSTGISSISSKQNLESPFIGGMYAIEFTRRLGISTTDNQYDDNNFIICLKRGVDVNGNPDQLDKAEKAENFSSVTGILEPQTSYNLRITPVRNLLRHVNTIASSIYKKVGSIIKFTYSEGNVDVVTAIDVDSCIEGNYSGELLSEKQDVQWDDTNIGVNPIWIPEYIEFEYPLSFYDYLNIKNNPYKTIEVSNGNTNFIKGFIIEIRWKPVGGIAYFKLLRVWQ